MLPSTLPRPPKLLHPLRASRPRLRRRRLSKSPLHKIPPRPLLRPSQMMPLTRPRRCRD